MEIFRDMYLKGPGVSAAASPSTGAKLPYGSCRGRNRILRRGFPSVYVKFKLDAMPGIFEAAGATGDAYVLIWTTTPWTLPANAAVCLMPDADYVMVQVDGSNVIFAKELVEEVAEIAGWEDYSPGVRPGRPACRAQGQGSCAAFYLYLPHPPGP